MIQDSVKKIYLNEDYNCAETVLRAANEAYDLGLPGDVHKLVSAFGAGMGCERTCGAVCGAMAVLGWLRAEGRAHITPGFKELCAGLVAKVEEECGSIQCSALMAKYRKEDVRCLDTILRVAGVLDAYLKETEQAGEQ